MYKSRLGCGLYLGGQRALGRFQGVGQALLRAAGRADVTLRRVGQGGGRHTRGDQVGLPVKRSTLRVDASRFPFASLTAACIAKAPVCRICGGALDGHSCGFAYRRGSFNLRAESKVNRSSYLERAGPGPGEETDEGSAPHRPRIGHASFWGVPPGGMRGLRERRMLP